MARNQGWNVLTAVAGMAGIYLGIGNVNSQVGDAEALRHRDSTVVEKIVHFIGDQPQILLGELRPEQNPKDEPYKVPLGTAEWNVLLIGIGTATLTGSVVSLRK